MLTPVGPQGQSPFVFVLTWHDEVFQFEGLSPDAAEEREMEESSISFSIKS